MKEYNPFGLNQQETAYKGEANASASPFAQAGESRAPHTAEQGQFPQFQDTASTDTFSKDWQKAIESTSGMDELAKKIEAARNNGWGKQFSKFLGLNRKKVALLAIAALFIVGGVQAFNDKGGLDFPINAAIFSGKLIGDSDSGKDTNKLVQELDLILEEAALSDKNGSVITKSAEAGEGITHLARYALKDYLTSIGKSLSAEQKIYAEDYVQNRMGSEMLEVGEKLSFSTDLLSEAVSAAESLENWQIENLSQYVQNTSLL